MTLADLPPSATRVLGLYQRLLAERAPGLVEALYLHGSAALGAWVEGKSDLDFVAVLTRPADERDLAALAQAHREVAQATPYPALDGKYLRRGDLGYSADGIPQHPTYSDGRLRVSTRSGVGPVDRWILREHGIAVFGPELDERDLAVTWEEVAAYMADNLQSYWAPWLTTPRRLAWLLADDGVEWAVLGICRLLYGLSEGQLVSKVEAGHYTMARLPLRWHSILREAIGLRRGRQRRYRSRITRAIEAWAFLRYAIESATDGYVR